MPRVIGAALLAVTIAMFPIAAHADGSGGDPTVTAKDPESLAVKNSTEGHQLESIPSSSGRPVWRPPVGKPITYILDPQLRTDATGQPCVFIGQIPGEPGSIAEANNEAHTFELLGSFPLCQGSP